jgi:hypothetical protein
MLHSIGADQVIDYAQEDFTKSDQTHFEENGQAAAE